MRKRKPRHKKYIEISGGLGNQMFQYALYIKLSSQGYNVIIDDYILKKRGNQHNGLELNNAFYIQYNPLNLIDKYRCLYWRKLEELFGVKRHILNDVQLSELYKAIDGNKCYLRGYWQDFNIFTDIRKDVLEKFRFKIDETTNDKTLQIARQIINDESISVHIRRGDYLWPQNIEQRMGICDYAYYEKAIHYIKTKVPNGKLYFFTDDPEWVREKFAGLEFELVDWNTGKNSYLDMYLMSLCKHNIIANSSFSWWGAWINSNPRKIVIGPSRWYNYMDGDLMLEEWVRI